MIVKTLGKKLIIDTKLHLLVHKISPILIMVSIVLFLNMAPHHQKNKFQEPTLRTKIYDPINSPTIIDPVYKKDSGVTLHSREGLVSGECLMISFINNSHTKKIVSLLSDNLKNDKVLSKTILFVGYQTKADLLLWLQKYHKGETIHNFGVIRAALNLDLKEKGSGIMIEFYGKNGRHSDADYYYYLMDIMAKLAIKYKSCDIKFQFLKTIIPYLVTEQASTVYSFLNGIACSLRSNFSAHSVLLQNGIQSATLKSIQNNESPMTSYQIQSLLFSWCKQFGMHQDNLHSSHTLFYPTAKQSYLTAQHYIIPYLVFLIAIVALLLHPYNFQNMQFSSFSYRQIDILFVVLLILTIYYKPGLYILLLFGLLILSRIIHGRRSEAQLKLTKLFMILVSVLTGVYNCIMFMPAVIINFSITLILFIPRRILRVITIIALGYLIYFISLQTVISYIKIMIEQKNVNLIPLIYILIYILQ